MGDTVVKRGGSRLAEIRYQLRLHAGSHQTTYPLLKLLPNSDKKWLVNSSSDVCIEGYPRSGNSLIYRAFQYWNPTATVAHHVHVPMQVRKAVKLGIPTAVLIRQPADAVASLAVFFGGAVSIETLLRGYISFYDHLWDLRKNVAICEFSATINDPSLLPRELNRRFGSKFQVGIWDKATESQVRSEVSTYHYTERSGLDDRLPLPSEKKNLAKLEIKPEVESNTRFSDARDSFRRFTGTYGERK